MQKQAIVVGLGEFGTALAKALSARGVEVLAVDLDAARVQEAARFADEALQFDATDEAALTRTAPARRDLCVCAIGQESKEASIICTALLRQMGAPRVVARTNDPLHERILRLVGAHEVVNPEREFGERLATSLVFEAIIGEMPLGDDLVVTEIKVPDALAGKALSELALPRRFGVTIVAIRRGDDATVAMPASTDVLAEGDSAVVVAQPGAVQRMMEGL